VQALELGETRIEIVRRPLKHVHLTVHPPAGNVRIAAPIRVSLDTLRLFAISKLAWIRVQQRRMQQQDREPIRAFIDRESHHVWGRRCLLRVVEVAARPRVEVRSGSLVVTVRPGFSRERRQALVDAWYREQVRAEATPRLAAWAQRLGVSTPHLRVQRMRTKWGSANREANRVLLNTWLAKKPRECLDYVVLHEVAHMVERSHGPRFLALLDEHMPSWRRIRQKLSSLPTGPEQWPTSSER
jgi:predicted metal-dependent hydrolase